MRSPAPMIAVIANEEKYDCLPLLAKISALLSTLALPHHTIRVFPFTKKISKTLASIHTYIILGGDGTILSVFKHFSLPLKHNIAILAVNFGTLGYMAGVTERNALPIIKNYLLMQKWQDSSPPTHPKKLPKPQRKLFKEENRYALRTEYLNHRNKPITTYALNELSLRILKHLRPITVAININGAKIFTVRGDGVIVATPTGSTAYNLSAGGPILSPEIQAFVLTFISPHSLTVKPIVLAKNDVIELRPLNETLLGIDGNICPATPRHPFTIRCTLAPTPLTFIKPIKDSPYYRLKHKLHWGE